MDWVTGMIGYQALRESQRLLEKGYREMRDLGLDHEEAAAYIEGAYAELAPQMLPLAMVWVERFGEVEA